MSEKPAVEMRVPAHGVGKLRVGNPGNKGGGTTPKSIRLKFTELADRKVVKRLEELADSENEGAANAACRTILDHALPKQHEQTITLNNTVVYDAWADVVGELLGHEVLAKVAAVVQERLPENWQGE